MNVYDFDNTIYDGESSFDFFCFCILKKKSLIRCLPIAIYVLILYKLNLLREEKIYLMFNKFSKVIVDNKILIENFVDDFWIKNEKKLKIEFLEKLKSDDVIITGSPNFLINAIKDKLNTDNIICTNVDIENGKLLFCCFRNNKVEAFRKVYPDKEIEEFYTDSLSDKPMMDISKKVYLVKK